MCLYASVCVFVCECVLLTLVYDEALHALFELVGGYVSVCVCLYLSVCVCVCLS